MVYAGGVLSTFAKFLVVDIAAHVISRARL